MWTTASDIDRMYGAMDLLRSRVNRLFTDYYDRSYGEDYQWRATEGTPRTNIYDAGDHLEVRAEVAGFTKDDIKIKIQGNYLEISGGRKADKPEGYAVHRTERKTLPFTRSFTLPTEVDADKTEATLENGILLLSLAKAEAAKPKQIDIK